MAADPRAPTRPRGSAAMTTPQRLQRAFARTGISLDYRDGIYHVRDGQAEAHILLPDSLPLEDKAVRQLLAFAAVRRHDGQGSHGAVCRACATPDFHPDRKSTRLNSS